MPKPRLYIVFGQSGKRTVWFRRPKTWPNGWVSSGSVGLNVTGAHVDFRWGGS